MRGVAWQCLLNWRVSEDLSLFELAISPRPQYELWLQQTCIRFSASERLPSIHELDLEKYEKLNLTISIQCFIKKRKDLWSDWIVSKIAKHSMVNIYIVICGKTVVPPGRPGDSGPAESWPSKKLQSCWTQSSSTTYFWLISNNWILFLLCLNNCNSEAFFDVDRLGVW